MTITMNRKEKELTVTVEGRLDTLSSAEFENKIEDSLGGVEKLIFDFAELKYISSAGLRVILNVMQVMMRQGEMVFRNVCKDVMNVFEVTGFIDVLNIE